MTEDLGQGATESQIRDPAINILTDGKHCLLKRIEDLINYSNFLKKEKKQEASLKNVLRVPSTKALRSDSSPL